MLSLILVIGAIQVWVELAYMLAGLLFILGIKRLGGVKTAQQGNRIAAAGMGLAVAATMFLLFGHVALWIILLGVAVGSVIGVMLAKRVPMTAMPELVAFFNGLGGAGSMFVALAEMHRILGFRESPLMTITGLSPELAGQSDELKRVSADILSQMTESLGVVGEAGGPLDYSFAAGGMHVVLALLVSVLIGAVTLSGSLVAFAKLAGKWNKNRMGPLGAQGLNLALVIGCVLLVLLAAFGASSSFAIGGFHWLLVLTALLLGVGLVVAIGGADMPVVISLLNSYSGLAAAATGFALGNNLLIVAGSLVGASGLILTRIMCKAMNRSLPNVLFGGMGTTETTKDTSEYTTVKSTSAEEVAMLLDAAQSVIVVPGYGLAVAQAQHKVREMADLLEKRDIDVRYAIHPVAGRMPGHMNVLLAEADVPYDQLFDLDQINGEFKNADVVIVIGANDVCNPAANDDPQSPITGMPVLHVWEGRTVVVIKRSLSAGYAGIKNELFQADNCLMLFGDAKVALDEMVTELKEL